MFCKGLDSNDADALMIRQVAGGSGSVQGKVHIGMNHFNSTNPSVRITAEELDVADYIEEVIPETQRDKYTDIATLGFIGGFIVMMSLDVGLG